MVRCELCQRLLGVLLVFFQQNERVCLVKKENNVNSGDELQRTKNPPTRDRHPHERPVQCRERHRLLGGSAREGTQERERRTRGKRGNS